MRSRPAVFVDGGAPLFRPPSTATSCSEACCGRHAAGAISRLVLVSVSTHAPPPKDKDPARELVLVNAESQASRANYRRRRRRCRHSSVLPHSHTLGNRGHAAEQRPRYHQRRQPRSHRRTLPSLPRLPSHTTCVCPLAQQRSVAGRKASLLALVDSRDSRAAGRTGQLQQLQCSSRLPRRSNSQNFARWLKRTL